MPTGGELLVKTLEAQGIDRVFCVPGESYLAVLDALHDSPIDITICRQEGGAAMMADAIGRITGQVGVAFATRGPGATNAAAGLHIAFQDASPMILFIGQVQRDAREREAFQEIEYRRMFTEVAKWVAEIDDPARLPEIVGRAFAVALSGRPGPVVLALPEDMLRQMTNAQAGRPVQPAIPKPGNEELARLEVLLSAAQRPFAVLGGSGWDQESVDAMQDFAEAWSLPVGCSFRRQMLFDHLHPCYAGDVGIGPNPKLAALVHEADLLLLIGARMGEMPSSGYTLIDIPDPKQTLVHVYPDPEELGRVYRPDLPIVAAPAAFAKAVTRLKPKETPGWAEGTKAAHAEYTSYSTPVQSHPGDVQMGDLISWMNQHLPDDTIVCNGAGNYATWSHRFYRFRQFGTQAAPTSGSMGYGVPAAVALKQHYPDRTVVAMAGDGCFLMNGQEFATAVQYETPIIVIVVDNGMYGTIRMHQERDYPDRVSGTELKNPDFAALAIAYGGHGETVRQTADFAPAFQRAQASNKPSILHVYLDPEAITTTRTLSEIRGTG